MPKTAAGIYLEVMNRGGNHDLPGLDKQTRAKVKDLKGFFDAMATDEEQAFLLDRAADEGRKECLVVLVEGLLRKRFALAFREATHQPAGAAPCSMLKGPDFPGWGKGGTQQ